MLSVMVLRVTVKVPAGEDSATADGVCPATERQPVEREGPLRGHHEEAKKRGASVPFDARGLSPQAGDGQGTCTKRPPAESWWVQKLSADLTAD
jgi:hypothetical protein